MSSKKLIRLLDAGTAYQWKTEALDSLDEVWPLDPEIRQQLMDGLEPNYKKRGHSFLEPGDHLRKAQYIRKGLLTLYAINPVTHKKQVLYLWKEGNVAVLYKIFRNDTLNTMFYIEAEEDVELLAIDRERVLNIYNNFPHVSDLVFDVMIRKSDFRTKHQFILSNSCKKQRPLMMDTLFPEFKGRLSNEIRCSFLGIDEATLSRAR